MKYLYTYSIIHYPHLKLTAYFNLSFETTYRVIAGKEHKVTLHSSKLNLVIL